MHYVLHFSSHAWLLVPQRTILKVELQLIMGRFSSRRERNGDLNHHETLMASIGKRKQSSLSPTSSPTTSSPSLTTSVVEDLEDHQGPAHQPEELLDDYEEPVSSPGGSSTASGPIYIRTAGFEHHAQEVTAPVEARHHHNLPTASPTATSSLLAHSPSSRSASVLSRHSFNGLSPVKIGGAAKKKKSLVSLSSADSLHKDANTKVRDKKVDSGVVLHTTPSSTRPKGRRGKLLDYNCQRLPEDAAT